MGKTDNYLDIVVIPTSNGEYKLSVSYWYYHRDGSYSSCVTYTWKTREVALVNWLQSKKTKVFNSQLRVLCRNFGVKEVDRS